MFVVSKYFIGHQLNLIGQDTNYHPVFSITPCLVISFLYIPLLSSQLKRLHSKRLHNMKSKRQSSFVAELGMFLSFNAVISDESSYKLCHQTLDIVI